MGSNLDKNGDFARIAIFSQDAPWGASWPPFYRAREKWRFFHQKSRDFDRFFRGAIYDRPCATSRAVLVRFGQNLTFKEKLIRPLPTVSSGQQDAPQGA